MCVFRSICFSLISECVQFQFPICLRFQLFAIAKMQYEIAPVNGTLNIGSRLEEISNKSITGSASFILKFGNN